jgi:hypothetical protein
VKTKVIQGMIQVECTFNWSIENIMKISYEIKWIEIFNTKKLNKLQLTKPKWDILPNTISGNNTEGV